MFAADGKRGIKRPISKTNGGEALESTEWSGTCRRRRNPPALEAVQHPRPPRRRTLLPAAVRPAASHQRPDLATELEVLFRPDVSVRDGRYANNGWLQELPRQFSKLVWDNAALISPELAKQADLENGDIVELSFRGRTMRAPVWIQPGQAENSITLPLGYGREIIGSVGRNVGFNAYALRTSDALWFGDGLTIRKTGGEHMVWSAPSIISRVHGRGILHDGTLDQFLDDPHFAQEAGATSAARETLYHPDEYPYKGYKWGMVVDLNVCIGCHACTIACQAENNIPVVGKQQVGVHREMHWIRVDTFYSGTADRSEVHPSAGAVHALRKRAVRTGLPGRRHRARQRRTESADLQSLCRHALLFEQLPLQSPAVQFSRIQQSAQPERKAGKESRRNGAFARCDGEMHLLLAAHQRGPDQVRAGTRRIRDGEIVPACAQVCPAEAITFGNMNDSQSRLMRLKRSPLNYWMLGELNTQPRTSYLAKLRNLNRE